MKRIILLIASVFVGLTSKAQWTDDNTNNTPIYVGPNGQTSPKVYTAADGSTYISNLTFGQVGNESGQQIYLKKYSPEGLPLWSNEGMVIFNKHAKSFSDNYSMVALDDNNFIFCSKDLRNHRGYKLSNGNTAELNDVYISKITGDQQTLWGTDGIQLNTSESNVDCVAPSFSLLTKNEGLMTWGEQIYNDFTTTSRYVFKKISTNEAKVLASNVLSLPSDTVLLKVNSVPTVDGASVSTYFANVTSGTAGRMLGIVGHDANLNRTFKRNIFVGRAITTAGDVRLTADDKGGVYTYFAYLTRFNTIAIALQYFDNKGTPAYPKPIMVNADTLHYEFSMPVAYFNKKKGCLTLFYASREIAKKTEQMEVQEFTPSGYVTGETGKVLMQYPANSTLSCTNIVPLENNNVILVYMTSDRNNKIRAARLDGDYNELWRKIISNYHPELGVTSRKNSVAVGEPVNNQVVLAWSDSRISVANSSDIYGQNLHLDGFMGNKGTMVVDQTKLIMTVGDTLRIKPLLEPLGLKLNATFKSNYPNIVNIDEYGLIKASAYGKGIITVSAFDGTQTAQIEVQVLDTPYDSEGIHVFNGFSPNGDGANDVFYIQNVDRFPGNKLTVFDSTGQIYYQTTDYKNDWNGVATTGSYKGNLLPQGTYYYSLELSNGDKRKGYLVIKY